MTLNKKGLAAGLNLLTEVFPADIGEMKLGVYLEALADMPLERFMFAVRWLIKNRKPPYFPIFPTPAEIVEAAKLTPRSLLPKPPEKKQLPETPAKESRERLREMLDGLYAKFGPSARAKS